jgi:hypothetical protein
MIYATILGLLAAGYVIGWWHTRWRLLRLVCRAANNPAGWAAVRPLLAKRVRPMREDTTER